MSNEKRAYSYHTFYFTFVWNTSVEHPVSFEDYTGEVEKGNWKDISVSGFGDLGSGKIAGYQTVQYYNESARQAAFGWGKDYIRCYSYRLGSDAVYHINKEKTWDLKLYDIKLRVYNTGIGILAFEAENYDHRTLADVKAINEYGRRIFAPYMAPGGCSLCADELGFEHSEGKSFSNVSTCVPLSAEECIPAFIRDLLVKDVEIKPAIDDRMFVTCIVNDACEFENHMNYENDEKASESLYEFLYVDKQGDCTCPTASMRGELLDRSVYKRWLGNKYEGRPAGTIYGVTHHSFMCLTSAAVEYFVEIPFLEIYTHMACMVLAQRAMIIALDTKVSELSMGFEKYGGDMTAKRIRQLQNLQECHIAFLNQHMNIEITSQEQGIEIYELLQKEMYIVSESERVDREIKSLAEAANTSKTHQLNIVAIILAFTFVLEPLLQTVYSFSIGSYIAIIVITLFFVIGMILSRKKKY